MVAASSGGAGGVLDLGCGEGQVAGCARRPPGPAVVGVDPSRRQLANARRRGRGRGAGLCRGRGPATSPTASFDAVLCCLVYRAQRRRRRAARRGGPGARARGSFLLFVNHPMYQGPGSGFVDDRILDEHYWRVGPYLTEEVSVEQVDVGRRDPVRPPAALALRQPPRRARPAAHPDGRAAAARRSSSRELDRPRARGGDPAPVGDALRAPAARGSCSRLDRRECDNGGGRWPST